MSKNYPKIVNNIIIDIDSQTMDRTTLKTSICLIHTHFQLFSL